MIFICIYLIISVGGLVTKLCLTVVTPWTVAHQPPLSMGFSRQDYWSVLPFPSPGIFWTQKSNLGLLHCREIIYWLSYEGVFATPWTVTCQDWVGKKGFQKHDMAGEWETRLKNSVKSKDQGTNTAPRWRCRNWVQASFIILLAMKERICRKLSYNSCGLQGQRTKWSLTIE